MFLSRLGMLKEPFHVRPIQLRMMHRIVKARPNSLSQQHLHCSPCVIFCRLKYIVILLSDRILYNVDKTKQGRR